MRNKLLDFTRTDADLFVLQEGWWVTIEDATLGTYTVPVLPPIVEVEHQPQPVRRHYRAKKSNKNFKIRPHPAPISPLLLVNDGMHRIYAAMKGGYRINVLRVENTPEQYSAYPYYAYPLEGGWSQVEEVDEAPPSGADRKAYRQPEDHKALFRDFNAVFPGVQVKR